MKKKVEIHSQPPPEYGNKLYTRNIESELSAKNSIIMEILDILRTKGFLDADDEVWSQLCLDELLVNAIKHGNKLDKNKKVNISLYIDDKQWAIRVEDEGEGFTVDEIPNVDDEDSMELEHGRGILLMHSYMDEIWYYDKGNRVQLKKIKKSRLQKIIDKILVFLKLK